MYPHHLNIFGLDLSVWNAVFLVAVVLAWVVFRACARREPMLDHPLLRYAVVVYLSAISAQAFAYAFDVHTSMVPPPDVSVWRWYLDPLAGPKTLYGVLVLMPVSVALATTGTRQPLRHALDLWTPAMFTLLAVVRVGCFLQGCCHGARSDLFGIAFPATGPVFAQQLREGLVAVGATQSLPVIPTQAIEATALALLALWSWRHLAKGDVFLPGAVAYSIFRFGIEFVRADADRGFYGFLATSQWIALLVLVVAAAMAGGSPWPASDAVAATATPRVRS